MAQIYAKDQPAGFKNKIENVAVVGAGGQMGSYIVSELLSQGKHSITAITREGSKSQLPAGVHVKTVDYSSVDSIARALDGQDLLVVTLSVTAPPGTANLLADAAKKAGVQWILPNEFGCSGEGAEDAGRDAIVGIAKTKEREYLGSLGLNWIAVRTGFWYEWSLGCGLPSYGIDIAARKVRFMDDGTVKLNTSTWKHGGLAVAKLLALPVYPADENDASPSLSKWRNGFLQTSSFLVNQREMLASVQRVTGTTDADWEFLPAVPAEQLHREGHEMLKTGNFVGFQQQLYSRYFFPRDRCGQYEDRGGGLADQALGCVETEDIDEATRRSVKLVEEGYFVKRFSPAS